MRATGGLVTVDIDPRTGGLRGLINPHTGDDYLKAYERGTGRAGAGLFCIGLVDESLEMGKSAAENGAGRTGDAWRKNVIRALPGCPDAVNTRVAADGARIVTIHHTDLRLGVDSDDDRPGAPGEGGRASVRVEVEVNIRIPQDSTELLLTARVTNHEKNLAVTEFLFPAIRGVDLSDWLKNGERVEDVLIMPHHAGERIVNPATAFASERYLRFSRANSKKEPDGTYSRELNYCGLASMMWMDYSAGDNGLFLASYDPVFGLTGLRVETGGPENPWLGFSFRKYLWIAPGKTWTSPAYALGVHDGDWHWGARRYRAWFDTVVTQKEPPADLLAMPGLNPRYDFKNGGRVIHRFEEIPALFEEGRKNGLTHFFIAGWNRSGFDTDYPEYHPDMELGTPVDLEKGCRYVKEHGGIVTFYINARLFDTQSDYFDSLGSRWALRGLDGRMEHETYEPRTFAVMCPASGEWRKHIVDYATWMVKSYHAQGIYLDQLGSAEPHPCYQPDHGHAHPGEFNEGYVKLLDEVTSGIQAVDPSAFIMIENCGDIYGSRIFGSLTWNGEFYDEFFNVYKYTFPEHTQINMVHPRRIDDPVLRREFFYKDIARALLLGSVFWAAPGRRFGEDEELLDYFRKVLALRKAAAPYFAKARFVDVDGITVDEGIEASHWVFPDGAGEYSDMLVVANQAGLAGRSVTLDLTPANSLVGAKTDAEGVSQADVVVVTLALGSDEVSVAESACVLRARQAKVRIPILLQPFSILLVRRGHDTQTY